MEYEELNDLYSPLDIVRVIKSRRITIRYLPTWCTDYYLS